MRNALVLEVEKSGKVYQLIAPKDPNIGELIDVCSEMLEHCINLVDNLKKESEKKKKEAEEKLNSVIAENPQATASTTGESAQS